MGLVNHSLIELLFATCDNNVIDINEKYNHNSTNDIHQYESIFWRTLESLLNEETPVL